MPQLSQRPQAQKPLLNGKERSDLIIHLIGNGIPPIIVAEHVAPKIIDKKGCYDAARIVSASCLCRSCS